MRTINIFGRSVPIAILAILMCGAVASATLAIYFSIRGRVDVTERTPVIAEPSSYRVEMDQGEVTSVSITVINRSDIVQSIELDTVITGIDEGLTPEELTVTYSRAVTYWIPLPDSDGNGMQELTLMPDEEVPIEVTIAASWSAVPGSYAVRTDIIPVSKIWIESTEYTSENAGDVWFVPLTGTTSAESYSDEIHVNTGNQKLGAYDFIITYDNSIITVDTSKGTDGVDPGVDGFVMAVNATTPGTLIVNGVDVVGTGPGNDLHVLTIHWTKVGAGTTTLDLTVNELTNEIDEVIGTPKDIDGERTLI